MTTQDENRDRLAKDLYAMDRACQHCHKLISLYDVLIGKCPHCRKMILAGPDVDGGRLAQLASCPNVARFER